jgi:quercetin dioxygenase-like cupin family protein
MRVGRAGYAEPDSQPRPRASEFRSPRRDRLPNSKFRIHAHTHSPTAQPRGKRDNLEDHHQFLIEIELIASRRPARRPGGRTCWIGIDIESEASLAVGRSRIKHIGRSILTQKPGARENPGLIWMNKTTRKLLSVLAFCVCACSLPAQNYPPPFPREAAQKLFENDRVAVWDVTWPKGQPTAMHEHPVDQLSVTLVGGTVRVTRLGGTPTVNESKPGSVVLTPQGTVHMEEGLSDIPQRKIMLQLKPSLPQSDRTPVSFPHEGAVKLLENARVIAWDFTWKPGQKTPNHTDHLDMVIVFLDGGTIRSVTNGGQSKDMTRQANEVAYLPHNAVLQTEEAVQGSPRAVIVEFK